MSVGIYASEMWNITTKIAQKLDVFHQQCLRKILHVTYRDHVTNEEVLLRTGSRKLADTVAERKSTWQVTYCIYQAIDLQRLQCRELQTMEGEEEDVQRRHGAEHSRKTWHREPISHGQRLNTLRWIVLSGIKRLPNVAREELSLSFKSLPVQPWRPLIGFSAVTSHATV